MLSREYEEGGNEEGRAGKRDRKTGWYNYDGETNWCEGGGGEREKPHRRDVGRKAVTVNQHDGDPTWSKRQPRLHPRSSSTERNERKSAGPTLSPFDSLPSPSPQLQMLFELLEQQLLPRFSIESIAEALGAVLHETLGFRFLFFTGHLGRCRHRRRRPRPTSTASSYLLTTA